MGGSPPKGFQGMSAGSFSGQSEVERRAKTADRGRYSPASWSHILSTSSSLPGRSGSGSPTG